MKRPVILTPEAKKSLQENCDGDIVWNNENVDELFDRLEAHMKVSAPTVIGSSMICV